MTVRQVAPRATRPRLAPADRAGQVVLVCSGLAWVALASMMLPVGDGPGGAAVTGHLHHHAVNAPAGGGAPSVDPWSLGWVGGWLLMVVAMMWPLMVPTVNRVSRAAYPRWQVRLTLTTIATATLLWLALGLVAASAARVASVPAGSTWWQLAFIVVAALAFRSTRRTRLLWRCVKLPPVAPGGRRGLAGAARAGLVAWRRCAVLCGPVMIAMTIGHTLLVLVAASLSVWWEARHPRAWRDPVPLLLLGVAALGVVGSALVTW